MAEVTKKNLTSQRTTVELDLKLPRDLSSSEKNKIASDVGDFLVDQILERVNSLSSPVQGGKYKKTLNPEYKALKQSELLPGVPNLEFSGQMLNQLEARTKPGGKIELGVFGSAAKKADGHNNLSGESTLPERRFLPDVGQSFKSSISSEMKKIILDGLGSSVKIPNSALVGVRNREELLNVLRVFFPNLQKREIAGVIKRTPRFSQQLAALNLLDLL
jgi:hypothetical protein